MVLCHFCDHKNPDNAKRCMSCGAELPGAADREMAAGSDSLMSLIRSGRKIEAIKLYRVQTGLGLREATDAVEVLARREAGTVPASAAGGFEDKVLALLRSGNKIAAIKEYRGQTGVGLAEAKQAVETLAAQHGLQSPKSGCTGVLIFVALLMWIVMRSVR